MCGICGIINKDGSKVENKVLERMTRVMKHRGNDAYGVNTFSNIGLGHQRLSIIDLSEKANQPFSSADKRFWIVFNGEIYNFQSLRKELEPYYSFVSTSDTEVVLYSWIHWGKSCLERFNGMFAFAIWDSAKKELYCVRDRMGVKPFFYSNQGAFFIFASEIKSLLLHPQIAKDIDYTSLSDYLSVGYILGEKTIFSQIKKLLPASILRVGFDGAVENENYWDVRKYLSKETSISPDNIINILEGAVKRRLVSDVDIGFFVSGGIDSSAILKLASRHYKKSQTFSMGFPQATYSELEYAEKVTKETGSIHSSSVFYPPDENFLRKLAWFFDQPFADTSSVPTFQLCEFASKRVKVVLSGDGGDEMFGGYETYRADLFAGALKKIPFWNSFSKMLFAISSLAPASFNKVSTEYKIKQFLEYSNSPLPRAHYSWRLLFNDEQKKQLLSPEINSQLRDYNPYGNFDRLYDEANGLKPSQQNIYVDFKTWLADDVLTKIDISGMAHSLEIRSPFLDKEIAELAVSIPFKEKVDFFHTKKILKKALSQELPAYILNRKKEGFGSPVSLWLENSLNNLFIETINKESFKVFFPNTKYLSNLLLMHKKRKRDLGFCLWAILMFGLWADNYLDPISKLTDLN